MDTSNVITIVISVVSLGFAIMAFARDWESDSVTWQWGFGTDRSVWCTNIGFDTARHVRISAQFGDFYGQSATDGVRPGMTERCTFRMLNPLDDARVWNALNSSCGPGPVTVEAVVYWKSKLGKPRAHRFEKTLGTDDLYVALTGARRNPLAQLNQSD